MRRHVSPRTDLPLDLVRIELPAGATIPMPASVYAFKRQLIWVLSGELVFVEGDARHDMAEETAWSSAHRRTAALKTRATNRACIWWRC